MEPIEQWREEFEKFYASINDGFCPNQYDGQYDWFDAQNCWLSFLAAKRSQPVVELPMPDRNDHTDAAFYIQKLRKSLADAGIQYRIKGE